MRVTSVLALSKGCFISTLCLVLVLFNADLSRAQSPPVSAGQKTGSTTSVGCASPLDFGAIPNDGKDDGAAFRLMFETASVVNACVGPGHWTLLYNRFASVTLGQGQSLTGAGPSTIFDMTGNAKGGTWSGFQLNGGSLRLVSVNQIGLTNPDPSGQNHMIQVGAGDATVISDVVLGPSNSGRGDCIRLLGTDAAHQITRALISYVVAHACGRNGITIQHDVASASITDSTWNSIGDQDIDFEPTSIGPVTATITGNVILHTNDAFAVTLSDKGGGNETIFSSNLIIAGNVMAVRANNLTFANNTILGNPRANTGTFDVIRNSTGVRMIGNYLLRPASAPAGFVVRFSQNNGGFPSNAVISNNRIVQNGKSPAIHLEGASKMVVSGNNITMAVPWSEGYAISCSSVGASCDQNSMSQNVIESPNGTTLAAVGLLGWTTGNIAIGRNLVLGNTGSGFTNSVLCLGPFAGPVRINDNILGGSVSCTGASVGTNF